MIYMDQSTNVPRMLDSNVSLFSDIFSQSIRLIFLAPPLFIQRPHHFIRGCQPTS